MKTTHPIGQHTNNPHHPDPTPQPSATLPPNNSPSGPPPNSNGIHSAAEYQNSPKPLTSYAAHQPFTVTCLIETSCGNTKATAPTPSTSTTTYSATSKVAYHHEQPTSAPCPRSYDVTISTCRQRSPTADPPEPTSWHATHYTNSPHPSPT